jgi:formate hydrogenlyase regulatory protein HycA
MGFVVATLPAGPGATHAETIRNWYAVLHLFDRKGKHLKSDVWASEAAEEKIAIDHASRRLGKMLSRLEGIRFKDVKIELFKVEFDGQVFGLVDASVPEDDYERVDLVPNDLAFFEPWDGYYDT